MSPELILFSVLLFKHLIVDWFLQTSWQYRNKGNWRHPGGYFHAFLNVFGSIVMIFFASVFINMNITVLSPLAFVLFFGEFTSHYIMDWTKVNICRHKAWGTETSENFWRLTGFDQFVHLSYLVFMSAVFA